MAGGFDIAKAGWLHRQTSVLHRWKQNWFVLDRNGDLRYFESPDSPRAEERIVVRAAVTHIKTGPDCRRADPPEGVNRVKACYLELVLKDKEAMLLCAESMDDMRAWQIALDEARTIPVQHARPGVTTTTYVASPGTTIVGPPGYGAPPGYGYYGGYGYGYGGYPGHVIQPPSGQTQVIQTPTGTTTVVNAPAPPGQQIVYVDDGPHYRRRRYCRGGIYPVPLFFW